MRELNAVEVGAVSGGTDNPPAPLLIPSDQWQGIMRYSHGGSWLDNGQSCMLISRPHMVEPAPNTLTIVANTAINSLQNVGQAINNWMNQNCALNVTFSLPGGPSIEIECTVLGNR